MSISLFIFPSLFLCFCFSAHCLHQSRMHRVKMGQHQTNYLRQLNGISLVATKKSKPVNETIYDYYDKRYYIKVTVGSNNQTFLLIADTGSWLFWVPDSSCTSATCTSKHRFFQNSSTTYRPSTTPWKIMYGTGNASGTYGYDTVGVGTPPAFVLSNCPFGQAKHMDKFYDNLPEFDGIFGLGPFTYDGLDSAWMVALKRGILAKPMFTIYLEKDSEDAEGTPGGIITWGAVDHVNCDKNVNYVPLLTSKQSNNWSFNLTAVCYGYDCYNSTTSAMTDTGTSLIYGPFDEVYDILVKMGINETDGTIPCNACIKPVIFKICGHDYPLYKDQLIGSQDGVCTPNLQVDPGLDHWLIGDIFIQEYCQIHDYGNKRIGFAKSKHIEIL